MFFFNEYKCKNVVEYQKLFIEEIRAQFLYFVKFNKDDTILFKEYPNDCIVRSLNQRLIIIIIYNKSIFSTNNDCQKVCIFEKHRIFLLKTKRKGIMVSDFLFL